MYNDQNFRQIVRKFEGKIFIRQDFPYIIIDRWKLKNHENWKIIVNDFSNIELSTYFDIIVKINQVYCMQ